MVRKYRNTKREKVRKNKDRGPSFVKLIFSDDTVSLNTWERDIIKTDKISRG
jgi:hypothetical protein